VARRAGKAASRKARQRNVPRAPARPAGAPTPVLPGVTPDAREATSLDPPRRVTAPAAAGIGSSLSVRERAEYHYVERDLRNIGILTALLGVLLFVAWLAFSAVGLAG
jgi:hypothetical protein